MNKATISQIISFRKYFFMHPAPLQLDVRATINLITFFFTIPYPSKRNNYLTKIAP